MLTPADDYPLHQTPETINISGQNSNFYDRFFFNGYDSNGEIFFAAALGVYPQLNIMDGSFCLSIGNKQYNLRASKEMNNNRLDLKVGPIKVDIIKPLEETALIIDENEYGISGKIFAKCRHKAIEEPRFTHSQSSGIFIDCTRATQNITWSGEIKFNNKIINIDGFMGTRDRSWGLRPIGKREDKKNKSSDIPQFYWIWTPVNFSDHCVFYHKNDDLNGKTWNSRGVIDNVQEKYRYESESPKAKVSYKDNTRRINNLNIKLNNKELNFKPGRIFYMQGLGYSHPEWGHGNNHGSLRVAFDLINLDKAEFELANGLFHNLHIQTLAKVELKTSETIDFGQGVIEQLFIGPHKPSGFEGILDRITE
tara:strand:+ start:3608 stop:4705 length:1098 start_codon:yes stop_codon:yes gene_type:complete